MDVWNILTSKVLKNFGHCDIAPGQNAVDISVPAGTVFILCINRPTSTTKSFLVTPWKYPS
jgi:hypothetical protein